MEHCEVKCLYVSYIDVVFLVSLMKVVHDGGLMKLCQRGHVLHSINAALVHRGHLLPVHLCLLQVHHLKHRTAERA